MSTALKCTLDVLRSVQLRVLVQVLALVFFDRDTIFEDTLVQSKEESRPSITAPNKPAISSELSHLLFYDRPLFLLQRYSPQLLLRAHFGPTERTRPIVCSRLKAFFGSSHVIGFPQKFESFFTSLCSSIDILLFCHSLSFEDPSEKKRFSLHLQHLLLLLRLLLRFSVPTFIWLDPPSPFSNHQPFPPSLPPLPLFLFPVPAFEGLRSRPIVFKRLEKEVRVPEGVSEREGGGREGEGSVTHPHIQTLKPNQEVAFCATMPHYS